MTVDLALFLIVAVFAVIAAATVVLHPNPVYCALALIVALFQVAVLFVLLGAHVIAFLQILVYAGAIMVLFLFVIMLLNLQRDVEPVPAAWKAAVTAAGALLGGELVVFFVTRPVPTAATEALADDFGTITALGRALYTEHVLSFELTSVLLLVAVVGAVVIARRG